MRPLLLVLLVIASVGCGEKSPSAPTPARPSAALSITNLVATESSAGDGTYTHRVTFEVRESNGVGATITGLSATITMSNSTIGTAAVTPSDGFPSTRIPPNGTVSSREMNFRNAQAPALQMSISVTFTDDTNASGSVQASVTVQSGPAPSPPPPSPAPPPPSGPAISFGSGTHRVNSGIAPGRYYTDPSASCYWERRSDLGTSLAGIIANEFISYDAMQWIVDIASSDVGFRSDVECRTWFPTPRHGMQSTIRPGVWLVGSQISPGTYRTNASSGCYWERRRDFSGTLAAIIDNEFVSGGGQQFVEISGSDAGFHTDAECGTWTRVASATSDTVRRAPSASAIEQHWRMHRLMIEGRR